MIHHPALVNSCKVQKRDQAHVINCDFSVPYRQKIQQRSPL